MSLHCVVPLAEFKGTAGTVFFALSQDVLPVRQIQFVTVSNVASPRGIVVIYTINVKRHARRQHRAGFVRLRWHECMQPEVSRVYAEIHFPIIPINLTY